MARKSSPDPSEGCNPLLDRAHACQNRVFFVSSTFMSEKADWMSSAIFDCGDAPISKATI